MTIFFLIILLYLSVQLLTLISNLIFFPVLRSATPASAIPKISILIPARNEAHNLETTLPRIMQQPHALEVIVLDDNSSDATAQTVQTLSQQDARVRLLQGAPLPTGWGGKNWACHQLAQAAQGELLIFTDADVLWSQGTLESILAFQQRQGADFVSVWSRQITPTWLERLSVPTIDMILLGLLPYLGVRFLPWAAFAAGNGQLILWTRAAYQQMGGHAAFKQEVLEDVRMAQATKATGATVALALGGQLLAVRMYHNWRDVLEGFSKNILAAHSQQRWLLIADGLLQSCAYMLPWLLCFWQPLWLVIALLGVLQRALTCWKTQRNPWEALLQPLAPLFFWRIAWRALRQQGYQWKGRHYQ